MKREMKRELKREMRREDRKWWHDKVIYLFPAHRFSIGGICVSARNDDIVIMQ